MPRDRRCDRLARGPRRWSRAGGRGGARGADGFCGALAFGASGPTGGRRGRGRAAIPGVGLPAEPPTSLAFGVPVGCEGARRSWAGAFAWARLVADLQLDAAFFLRPATVALETRGCVSP